MLVIYLNGALIPYERAQVHIEDRGFLFGDGIYEVIRFYEGRTFLLKEHLDRLERSAREIRLALPPRLEMERAIETMMTSNSLDDKDGTIYIQVTRGAAIPRTHHFPTPEVKPTALIIARESPRLDASLFEDGVSVITTPDERWGRCDIKSINLLPNVLAKQLATEADATEAIFVKNGYVIEGSSTNFFGVKDGVIYTCPEGKQILSGCTRSFVINLAREHGYEVREEALRLEDLANCTELFLTSTTFEALPIVSVDGRPVGNGKPGPVVTALHKAYTAVINNL